MDDCVLVWQAQSHDSKLTIKPQKIQSDNSIDCKFRHETVFFDIPRCHL